MGAVIRYLLPIVVVVGLTVLALQVLAERRRRLGDVKRLFALVDRVRDLAWDHDALDPKLCGLVLDRIRRVDERPTAIEARLALDDILMLARDHRESSPELSVILIDTIRNPQELT